MYSIFFINVVDGFSEKECLSSKLYPVKTIDVVNHKCIKLPLNNGRISAIFYSALCTSLYESKASGKVSQMALGASVAFINENFTLK